MRFLNVNKTINYRRIVFIGLICAFQIVHSQQPKLMLPIGHTNSYNSANFSPDSKRVVTTSNSEIKIWDAVTGSLLVNLEGHKNKVNCAHFSEDGKRILTASNDSTAKIWEISTGKLLINIEGHDNIIFSKYSPDYTKIITITYKECKIWDASSGKLITELKGIGFGINSAEFSFDSKKIVTASSWESKVWDAGTGNLLAKLEGHKSSVTFSQFSPDGNKIVTSSSDKTVKIWNALNGSMLSDLYLGGPVLYAVFSPDGKTLVLSSGYGTVGIWDTQSGKLLRNLAGHIQEVNTALFSPDGMSIITASKDGTAKIWDFQTGKLVHNIECYLKENDKSIFSKVSAQYSPNGKKIITTSSDHSAKIWDANTGKLLVTLKGKTKKIITSSFSNDGRLLITSIEKTVNIWDCATGKLVLQLKGQMEHLLGAIFSENHQKILTFSKDGKAKLFDISNGALLLDLKHEGINLATFSPDGSKIVTESYQYIKIWDAVNGTLLSQYFSDYLNTISSDAEKLVTVRRWTRASLWDVSSGNLIADLKGHTDIIEQVAFSSDSKKVVTISYDGTAKVWETSSGKLLLDLKHSDSLMSVIFSPDGKKIVIGCNSGAVYIWNCIDGNLISTFKLHSARVFFLKFSPDASMLLTVSNDNSIKVLDIEKRTVLFNANRKSNDNYLPFFSSDGNKLLTISNGKTVNIWEFKTKKITNRVFVEDNGYLKDINEKTQKVISVNNSELCLYDLLTGKKNNTLISLDSAEYLNLIPTGYYMCSPNAAKLLHYVTKNLKVITFEQLDVKYNRPDKVLEAIGCPDTALINSYRKAYYKRIKKLGLDTTAFRDGYSVPEADFANRDKIENNQKDEKIDLHFSGVDSIYKLDRFNVWINEVPLFGLRGISLRKQDKNNIDTSLTITLSQGENRIETSITNVSGTESYRMPLNVNYFPEVQHKETIHFIGIGIDKFSDKRHNLNYSVKDIRDLSLKLKVKYKEDIVIDTLFNENVTINNVKALKQKLQKTNVNDKVIISYSGHGLLSKEYDYYLSTYMVNFEKPEINGLPYDELESLLDSIPARKKLLLIDACHSGEVDKDEVLAMQKSANKQGLKGMELIEYPHEEQIGLKNSFELMQSLFVNVGKNTGTIIISAAAGNQFALERDNLKNGVFTYSILETMNKYPTLKISELKRIISERVMELTNGLQKPTYRNETIAVDWLLW